MFVDRSVVTHGSGVVGDVFVGVAEGDNVGNNVVLVDVNRFGVVEDAVVGIADGVDVNLVDAVVVRVDARVVRVVRQSLHG